MPDRRPGDDPFYPSTFPSLLKTEGLDLFNQRHANTYKERWSFCFAFSSVIGLVPHFYLLVFFLPFPEISSIMYSQPSGVLFGLL